jgi:hypothetical protein
MHRSHALSISRAARGDERRVDQSAGLACQTASVSGEP